MMMAIAYHLHQLTPYGWYRVSSLQGTVNTYIQGRLRARLFSTGTFTGSIPSETIGLFCTMLLGERVPIIVPYAKTNELLGRVHVVRHLDRAHILCRTHTQVGVQYRPMAGSKSSCVYPSPMSGLQPSNDAAAVEGRSHLSSSVLEYVAGRIYFYSLSLSPLV